MPVQANFGSHLLTGSIVQFKEKEDRNRRNLNWNPAYFRIQTPILGF
jgi:hypothetical protein